MGDDTRNFAPPYLPDDTGADSSESAYFRGHQPQQAVDHAQPFRSGGASPWRAGLIAECDVLAENFKTGTLAKYGLGVRAVARRVPASSSIARLPGSATPAPTPTGPATTR